MKLYFFYLIFIIDFITNWQQNDFYSKVYQYIENHKQDNQLLQELQIAGKMDGFFTSDETEQIFQHLFKRYRSFVNQNQIGQTYQKRPLYAYILSQQQNTSNPNLKFILFTAAHHSRELVTVSMVIIIFIQFLRHLYQKELQNLFEHIGIIIVPIVNLDSYTYISESYGQSSFKNKKAKRKNMNDQYCKNKQGEIGVDLNRNYDFHFGENKEDSYQCGETYRGPFAFSEPETQAIQNLVKQYEGIISAMNFHAFGNMWIRPFNYSKNKLLVKNDEIPLNLRGFYLDFEIEVKSVTPTALYGNAIKMVNYQSYGEASDWMLGKRKIAAFSPELGTGQKETETFYPNQNYISEIINLNYKIVNQFILMHDIKIIEQYYNIKEGKVKLGILNQSLMSINQLQINFIVNTKNRQNQSQRRNLDLFKAKVQNQDDISLGSYDNKFVIGNISIERYSKQVVEIEFKEIIKLYEQHEVAIEVIHKERILVINKININFSKPIIKLNYFIISFLGVVIFLCLVLLIDKILSIR